MSGRRTATGNLPTGIIMIQPHEIIVLLLGLGVLVFILENRQKLHLIPASRILTSAFSLVLAGWILTVLESLFWKDVLNFLEHFCYAAGSFSMAVWCWKVFKPRKDPQ